MKKLLTIILIFSIQNSFAQIDTFTCKLLQSVVIDSKGNIFITDLGYSSLRKLSLDGIVSTIYKFKRISKYTNR